MVAFAPGAVLTAANLNTAFNALTIRTVTGTSDTLVLADNGGCVTYSNASATTSTIPPNSSVAFAVGTKIVLVNLGAGVVTVTAGAGVTVNGSTLTLAQNAGGTCIKTATNTWSFLPFSSGVGAANFSDTATGTYSGFKYLTFSASNTINISTAGFADVFLVGGGAAGGFNAGGGGGGGGIVAITNAYLPAGALTVTIGAGGSASGNTPNNGLPSRLDSFFAPGGGGGGGTASINGDNGKNGASGGGGQKTSGTGGSGNGTIGNNGGTGSASTAGGGGGGGSAVGAVGSLTTGGAGGAGTITTIGGTTPTGAYVAGNFQAGGGGGGGGTVAAGAGGAGGGGAGAVAGAGTAGAGGAGGVSAGGGGGGTGAGASFGGNGGGGLVIVRVAV